MDHGISVNSTVDLERVKNTERPAKALTAFRYVPPSLDGKWTKCGEARTCTTVDIQHYHVQQPPDPELL